MILHIDNIAIIGISPAYIESNISYFLDISSDISDEYWSLPNFIVDLPMKWELSFAITKKETPIAYAILSKKTVNHCHLHHFMVHRDWRRYFIGRRMINEIKQRAMVNDLTYITLKVQTKNTLAQSFYLRHGFKIKSEHDSFSTYELFL